MRVCDICKTREATYDTYASTDTQDNGKQIEVCKLCYGELRCRQKHYKYLAYAETVEAMTGKRPRKSHWWDKIEW